MCTGCVPFAPKKTCEQGCFKDEVCVDEVCVLSTYVPQSNQESTQDMTDILENLMDRSVPTEEIRESESKTEDGLDRAVMSDDSVEQLDMN